MNCKNCGTQLGEDAAFCFNCGAPVAAQASSVPEEPKIRKKLPQPLWIKDCPIIFNNCTISDRPDGSGEICLSISILNISDRDVEALYFDLRGLDVLNEEKCNIKDICHLDLCIKPGKEFTLPEPVLLPDKSIRRIRIVVRHVCFTDETIWSYSGDDVLTGTDIDCELYPDGTAQKIYSLQNKYIGKDAGVNLPEYKYYPVLEQDHWICACGRFNLGEKCLLCGVDKNIISEHFAKGNIEKEWDEEEKDDAPIVEKDIYPISFAETEKKIEKSTVENSKEDEIKTDSIKTEDIKADNIKNDEEKNLDVIDDDATEILPINKALDLEKPLFSFNDIKCKFCGTELKADDMFCFNCGNKVQ